MNILGFFQRLGSALQLPIAVLPVAGSRLPGQLAEESGLAVAAVRAALAALEMAGLVGVDGSGWFRTVRKGARGGGA